MEIKIPSAFFELLLIQAAETELTVEEIVERAIKNYIERTDDIAD